ncbi:MAG TPA: aminodeoxychorismate lyase [Methylophilaceae bacterium]|jgi:4-amino-4-deoxychorismate lyase
MTSTPTFLINGQSDNLISPFDRGFAYGDGVFRTIKVIAGRPLNWLQHYSKLSADCNALSISCPSANLLLDEADQLFAGNDGALKIIITRGESARGYAIPSLMQPNRVLIRSNLPVYPQANYEEGVQLHLCELRLSHQPKLAGIKHLNRLENVLARSEWSDSAVADGLLLDQVGDVIECTMSNIFARFGEALITPDLSKCGVAGLTRQQIIVLAPQLGLNMSMGKISLPKLMQADELVICNSLYGVWQVRSVNEQHWPKLSLATQLMQRLELECV